MNNNTPASSSSYVNLGFSGKDNNLTAHIEPDINVATTAACKAIPQSPEPEAEEEVEKVEIDDDVDAERGYDVMARERVYYNDDVYMTSKRTSLKLDSLQQYLLNKLSGDDIDAEFKVSLSTILRPISLSNDSFFFLFYNLGKTNQLNTQKVRTQTNNFLISRKKKKTKTFSNSAENNREATHLEGTLAEKFISPVYQFCCGKLPKTGQE